MLVKKQILKIGFCGVKRGGLAGTKFFVNLEKSLRGILRGVLFKRSFDRIVVTEKFVKLSIGIKEIIVEEASESSYERCNADFTCFIYSYICDVILVSLVFKPRASVGDNGG